MERLFAFWLAALPLVIWNGAYERPKVLWFLLGSFFLLLRWVRKRKQLVKFLDRGDVLFLFWLGVLLVSSLLGSNPAKSILGGSYRFQGVLFFFALWTLGKTVAALSASHKKLLVKVLAGVAVFEAVLIIAQKFLASETLIFGRPLGTFGEPNAAAGFLAGAAAFTPGAPILLVILLAIILTSSRAGLVSFAFVAGGILLRRTKLPIRRIVMLGVVACLAGIFIFAKAQAGRPDSPFENRALFRKMAVGFIQERPLLGWGPESQEALYEAEYARREMPLYGLIIDRSHNLFLDVAIWSGLLGLFFFLGWLWIQITALYRGKHFLNLLGVFALFLFSMFQPLGVTHWVLLMVLLNVVSFEHGKQKDRSDYGRYRPRRLVSGRIFT